MPLNAVEKTHNIYMLKLQFLCLPCKKKCLESEGMWLSLQVCPAPGSSSLFWGASFRGKPNHLPGSGPGRFQRRQSAMVLKMESQRTGAAMAERYCSGLCSLSSSCCRVRGNQLEEKTQLVVEPDSLCLPLSGLLIGKINRKRWSFKETRFGFSVFLRISSHTSSVCW